MLIWIPKTLPYPDHPKLRKVGARILYILVHTKDPIIYPLTTNSGPTIPRTDL